jgi:multicomponent Na+:H+ antiporter subunit E
VTATVLRIVWITVLWAGLWGEWSAPTLAAGVLVASAVTAVFRAPRLHAADRTGIVVRPLPALHFLVVFLWLVLRSSLQVAATVVRPRQRIHTGIVAVPLRGASDGVATIVAGAVTLTPGTLTLEATGTPTTLYVHALDTRDLEAVRRDVRRFEVLAIRAFGDAAARAGLTVDDSRAWEGP